MTKDDFKKPKKAEVSQESSEYWLTEDEKEFISRLKKQIEEEGEHSSYMVAGMIKRIP